MVGGSLDALLGLLAPALGRERRRRREREALVAALNGVLGDYLAATGNPLAIADDAAPRRPSADARARRAGRARCRDAGQRLLVLLHGLCMNDLQWPRERPRPRRGAGARPRLHAGATCATTAACTSRSTAARWRGSSSAWSRPWPQPLERARAASATAWAGWWRAARCTTADAGGLRWPQRVDDLVFLGTPHHGAPLERAGNWVDLLLGATPYAAPFARLGKVRSAGITDLRHGNLLDEDWVGRDRFARARPTAASRCRCPTACAATPSPPASAQQGGDAEGPPARRRPGAAGTARSAATATPRARWRSRRSASGSATA
ncbi:MAG: hypothetical protein MZW92_47715 [Comamonadaceae bacterium]|nr:hypothetical protein [Comamonadaceae bacterium]